MPKLNRITIKSFLIVLLIFIFTIVVAIGTWLSVFKTDIRTERNITLNEASKIFAINFDIQSTELFYFYGSEWIDSKYELVFDTDKEQLEKIRSTLDITETLKDEEILLNPQFLEIREPLCDPNNEGENFGAKIKTNGLTESNVVICKKINSDKYIIYFSGVSY